MTRVPKSSRQILAVSLFSLFTFLACAEDRTVFSDSIKEIPVGIRAVAGTAAAAVDAAAPMEFMLSLKMRDLPALQARVHAGELISPDEMASKYYPLAADYQAQLNWLTGEGFTIVKTDPNRLAIFAKGTHAQIQHSLQVTLSNVTVSGKTYTSAVTAPSLPSSLAPAVLGINGLQPHIQLHRHSQPSTNTSNHPPFLPSEIIKAYGGTGVTQNGSGQTIGIVIDTFPKNSDLTAFWTAAGVNQSLNNMSFIQVVSGTLPAVEGEESLDVEWSSGIASAAKVRVYATTDLSFVHLDQAYQQILNDLASQPGLRQVSISLGLGETFASASQMNTDAQYFASLAAGGVSVFVSSGDGGSSPSQAGHDHSGPVQIETPGSDPSVTCVGGTSLFLTSNGTVNSESAWFDGGGGTSIQFNRPAYQVGNGLPSGNARCVPDVASAGDPDTGSLVVLNGVQQQYGGTSWSAPTWAGFCALINQSRAAAGLAPVGALGPKLYPLLGTSNFRDITTGSNGNNGVYNAGAGYDLCTGLGVPNLAALIQTLSATGGGGGGTPNLTNNSDVANTAPTTVAVGQTMTVTSSVINNGTGAAGPFTVRYRLSTDTTFDTTDPLLGDAQITGLAANGTATASFTGPCPNVTPGNYNLIWFIDALGEVAESNENDNTFFRTTQITVTAASSSLPNLTLDQTTTITAPATIAVGSSMTVSCKVINNGTVSAGAFSVRYRLSTDTTYSPTDDALIGDAAISSLGANAKATATVTANCPNVPPGQYYVIFSIDPFGEVAESNETDNIWYRTGQITVTAGAGQPNLTYDPNTPIVAPLTVAAGGPITVSTGVINNGVASAGKFTVRYRLSTDTNYDTTDPFVGDAPITSLAAGSTVVAQFSGTCPNIAAGSYWLIWSIDAFGEVAESSESDNLWYYTTKITVTNTTGTIAPIITSGPSFTPDSPSTGDLVSFTVTASDPQNSPLTYAWDFGDGSTDSGSAPAHTYQVAGDYTVNVTISDALGASTLGSVNISIAPTFSAASLPKHKFALNFKSFNDSIDVTMTQSALQFALSDADVAIFIGGQQFDTASLLKGKASGDVNFGKFTLNTRSGTLRYTASRVDLQDILVAFGATNTTVKNASVSIPIVMFVNGAGYGGTYTFSYTAKQDSTGNGK
ncbi:MAG TPA: CARDB domain-containing protein [Planctomycetota bacterium]|nr:CARDB domain-containing protein [Planctomycetota bacterium]